MNYGTDKPIVIYTWKDTKLNQPSPKVLIKSMNPNKDFANYNPETNAINLAKLFSMSLPGNTLDEFYTAIAKEILPLLNNPEIIELLKDNYDLSNRIRIAVNQLADKEI